MRPERRKTQNVDKSAETSSRHRLGRTKATKTDLIASWIRQNGKDGVALQNLMPLFSVTNLRQAYDEISGSKAVGIDGMTKDKYGKHLEQNLQRLHGRMRKMAYRPSPARQVLIPKPDGRKRPIAISNFEDKLVQWVAAKLFNAIYDKGFRRFSFGFRPKRGCHGAIAYLHDKLRKRRLEWIVDVDLKSFFNTIDHDLLMKVVSERIADRKLLRYLTRMLKAGILIEGNCQENEQGTPQGSIVSPILANLFLDRVVDEWFERTIKPELGGMMVRYADDFVVAFATAEQASQFVEKLEARLKEYRLELNKEKTRLVRFGRNDPEKASFDFLGFTFYWGKDNRDDKRAVLKVRTSAKTLKKKIQDFTHWIKEKRSRLKLDTLWEMTEAKLEGHYQYYGVTFNRGCLYLFYKEVVWNLFKWLNRRSQMKSYSWESFKMRLKSVPLPFPTARLELVNLHDPKLYCC